MGFAVVVSNIALGHDFDMRDILTQDKEFEAHGESPAIIET